MTGPLATVRRLLFLDAPADWIARFLRVFAPLGVGVTLLFTLGLAGSAAPVWSIPVIGLGIGLAWGLGFPAGIIRRHRTAVLELARGRAVEVWTLRREREVELALPRDDALDLSRRAVGRIGGRVTAERGAAFDAWTPQGVVLHVDVSKGGAGSQIHLLATPRRKHLLADEGATLRVLDLMESALVSGLRAPLPDR